jgi:hypothetical protein
MRRLLVTTALSTGAVLAGCNTDGASSTAPSALPETATAAPIPTPTGPAPVASGSAEPAPTSSATATPVVSASASASAPPTVRPQPTPHPIPRLPGNPKGSRHLGDKKPTNTL